METITELQQPIEIIKNEMTREAFKEGFYSNFLLIIFTLIAIVVVSINNAYFLLYFFLLLPSILPKNIYSVRFSHIPFVFTDYSLSIYPSQITVNSNKHVNDQENQLQSIKWSDISYFKISKHHYSYGYDISADCIFAVVSNYCHVNRQPYEEKHFVYPCLTFIDYSNSEEVVTKLNSYLVKFNPEAKIPSIEALNDYSNIRVLKLVIMLGLLIGLIIFGIIYFKH